VDPSGIGGGSVWREEIARGIQNAALVVCILTEDYTQSEWCLKELALAKECGTPIMAVSTEHARITDELQVYVYTRQMVPFEPAITSVDNTNKRNITYTYDDNKFAGQFRLLLDGVRDEVEKHRKKQIQTGLKRHARRTRNRSSFFGDNDSDDGITEIDLNTITDDFVFLSHGDQNRTFAQRVYDRLTESGVFCFFDGAQGPSDDMAARIHLAKEAILKCACFVVIISNRTAMSELVRDQLAFAEDKGKPIMPIMLNELELTPDKLYTLSRTKLLHFTPELGFNASFAGLLAGVREHVSSAVGTSVRQAAPPVGAQRTTRATLLTAAARAKALGRLKIKASNNQGENEATN
jgi:hypothetical protein